MKTFIGEVCGLDSCPELENIPLPVLNSYVLCERHRTWWKSEQGSFYSQFFWTEVDESEVPWYILNEVEHGTLYG